MARARWPITLNLAPSVIELNDTEMIHRFRPICSASCRRLFYIGRTNNHDDHLKDKLYNFIYSSIYSFCNQQYINETKIFM